MMKLAVLDLETDPFAPDTMVWPFVGGFYTEDRFISWWSPNCVKQMVDFLQNEEEQYVIYAHNGGRFDYFYFLPYLKENMRIVNGRIIQAMLGKHELRDSFAIMPFALKQFEKTEIDYNTFRADLRETHRGTIVSYLRDDCVNLWKLCSSFRSEFGDSLTIGSASLKQLKKFHTFSSGSKQYDSKFREKFYFGGRCQVFKSGIIDGPVNVYDVNSMYPYVMANYLHPMGIGNELSNKIEKNTMFVVVQGVNRGAFPQRMDDGSLDFTTPVGVYHTTIHEYRAALETKTFAPSKILKTYGFHPLGCFDEFVSHFYNARRTASEQGDKIKTIFYKFVLNSAYGKFAQNPQNYFDWSICPVGELPANWHECVKSCVVDCRLKWSPVWVNQGYIIWQRPTIKEYYYNIAIGASITGAARAHLLRGLAHAKTAYYCDTDSIICHSLSSVPLGNSALGDWKLETSGDRFACAGKKLYAIWRDGKLVKKAHKGANLSGDQILDVCRGNIVEYRNPVPNFRFDGTYRFTKRNIRKTA